MQLPSCIRRRRCSLPPSRLLPSRLFTSSQLHQQGDRSIGIDRHHSGSGSRLEDWDRGFLILIFGLRVWEKSERPPPVFRPLSGLKCLFALLVSLHLKWAVHSTSFIALPTGFLHAVKQKAKSKPKNQGDAVDMITTDNDVVVGESLLDKSDSNQQLYSW